MSRTDVLVVTVDSTSGWRTAADELVGSLSRAGVSVAHARTGPVRDVRTFMLTDYVQARAARAAAASAIAEHEPAAIIYCGITAALLWPRPGAIWLDSIAAENRPGRHGVWQRTVERRRLRDAPLLLSMSDRPERTIVVRVPVRRSGELDSVRDVDALLYAADPKKRRLDYVLGAWSQARREGETLVVAGLDGVSVPPGVRLAGRLPPADYRALLRRTRVFLAAPVREDYGIAPLEALADGCLLVTTPSTGPYPARELARRLDPRLVSEDLQSSIRVALDDPLPGYADRAWELLEPFTREAVDLTVANEVLPRLLRT